VEVACEEALEASEGLHAVLAFGFLAAPLSDTRDEAVEPPNAQLEGAPIGGGSYGSPPFAAREPRLGRSPRIARGTLLGHLPVSGASGPSPGYQKSPVLQSLCTEATTGIEPV
jgi:hypothetical protein